MIVIIIDGIGKNRKYRHSGFIGVILNNRIKHRKTETSTIIKKTLVQDF